jgi:hypothetical protein
MTTPGVRPKGLKNKVSGGNNPEKGFQTPHRTTETPQNRVKCGETVGFSAAC